VSTQLLSATDGSNWQGPINTRPVIGIVDNEAILLATVKDHLLLATLEDAHLNPDLAIAIVHKEVAVKLGELVQHVVVGYVHE
jgi:hypothetical protein